VRFHWRPACPDPFSRRSPRPRRRLAPRPRNRIRRNREDIEKVEG